jgi:hypothetical protein
LSTTVDTPVGVPNLKRLFSIVSRTDGSTTITVLYRRATPESTDRKMNQNHRKMYIFSFKMLRARTQRASCF